MFDGSYRAPRRAVNLGTKRQKGSLNNSSTNGKDDKAALLEQARRRREERRILAERQAAATTVQRHGRAYSSRRHTQQAWERQLEHEYQKLEQQQQTHQQQAADMYSDTITPLLNAILRLTSKKPSSSSTALLLSLRRYAAFAAQQLLQSQQRQLLVPPQNDNRMDIAADMSPSATRAAATHSSRPRAVYIVHSTLALVAATSTGSSAAETASAQALATRDVVNILLYTLDLPHEMAVSLNGDNGPEKLIDLPLESQNPSQVRSVEQQPMIDSNHYWNRAGGIAELVTAFGSLQRQTTRDANELQSFLYRCIQVCLPLDTVYGRALDCALRISTGNASNGLFANATESLTTMTWDEELSSCLQVLTGSSTSSSSSSSSMNDQSSSDKNDLLAQTTRHLVSRNMIPTLQCLFQPSHHPNKVATLSSAVVATRLQLTRVILLGRGPSIQDMGDVAKSSSTLSSQLIWLLNRVARGDALDSGSATTTNTSTSSASIPASAIVHEVEDSSDDDNDEETHTTNGSRLSHGKTKTSSVTATSAASKFRLSKQDLQTVPKLDALLAQHVRKADQVFAAVGIGSSSSSISSSQLESLAVTMVDPALWLEWGIALWTQHGTVDEQSAGHLRQGRRDYVTILAIMLQATTGLRPGQNASSSRLLKELASSPILVSNLWQHVLTELECTTAETTIHVPLAASLFSDLFAHRLIALRDVQFLKDHTATPMSTPTCVDAVDVIARLRSLLYDVYWANPVQAKDFKLILTDGEQHAAFPDLTASTPDGLVAAARARFLLVGTKLWNSLYERWCRLVRHAPFCDEATWCFPASISVENVVAAGRDSDRNEADDDVMDIVDSSDDEMDVGGGGGGGLESDQLAAAFSQPKMARLLSSIPQALPFDRRVKLFDGLLRADKLRTQDETSEMQIALMAMVRGEDAPSTRQHVEIRRDRLYDDSKVQLSELGSKLKRRVHVSFINQHGTPEAGIDGGGVFKEFIDDLIKDAFSLDSATSGRQLLFSVTPLETLAVNSDLVRDQALLSHYEFLGRVLGKAVYESILVEPQFCLPFLNQLLGKSNSIEDLKNFDPEYYRNLSKLLNLSALELQNMDLTFELPVGSGANTRTVDLIPNGRNVAVTKSNVIQYIHLVSHQRLNVLTAQQTRAFLQGFRELIPASWVRLFSGYELQKVISGDDSAQGFDVSSLRQAMQYGAGYHPDQPIIQWFWEIVDEMTADQKRKFLKFMTSCSRPPLMGFENLEPAPCVQQINLPDYLFTQEESAVVKQAPLPTSSTCMNLLKLPNYRGKELMKRKLLVAIESGAGFELT